MKSNFITLPVLQFLSRRLFSYITHLFQIDVDINVIEVSFFSEYKIEFR